MHGELGSTAIGTSRRVIVTPYLTLIDYLAEGQMVIVIAEGDDLAASPHGVCGVFHLKKYSPAINLTEGEARREICAEGAMFTSSASVASTPSAAGLVIFYKVSD